MSETDDLVPLLRSMARCDHDDLSLAGSAADEIERLRTENASLKSAAVRRAREELEAVRTDVVALREEGKRREKCIGKNVPQDRRVWWTASFNALDGVLSKVDARLAALAAADAAQGGQS